MSNRGRLWSYTDSRYTPPPPFVPRTEPFVPVVIAAVELSAEKMVVLGQVVDGVTTADLKVGMEVEMVLGTLYEDDDHDYVVWKWKPVDGASGPGRAALGRAGSLRWVELMKSPSSVSACTNGASGAATSSSTA